MCSNEVKSEAMSVEPPPGEGPLISVVVTTYTLDRLKDVKELLDSLRAQSYPNIEVVFVGESCRELCEEVSRYAQTIRIAKITILFNNGEPGVSAARNLGIRHARGDIIAFIDDDTIAAPNWAEELAKTYAEENHVIGVAGAAEPLWEKLAMAWFPPELYWMIGCTSWQDRNEERRDAYNAPTVNVSYKREAFQRAGLFSTAIGPQWGNSPKIASWAYGTSEDTELFLRIRRATGQRIVYNPKVKVRHKVTRQKLGLRRLARFARGVGLASYPLMHRCGREDRKTPQLRYSVLYRILTRLLPRIFVGSLKNPLIAWRQLQVTVIAVLFAGLGYIAFLFPFTNPFRKGQLPGGSKLGAKE
jgi:glycosyltransferase involved in cell wall biosynthesis